MCVCTHVRPVFRKYVSGQGKAPNIFKDYIFSRFEDYINRFSLIIIFTDIIIIMNHIINARL